MIHIFQNSHIKYDIFQEVNFKYTSIFCPKRHFQYNIVIQATLDMTFYHKCHLKYELLCHILCHIFMEVNLIYIYNTEKNVKS